MPEHLPVHATPPRVQYIATGDQAEFVYPFLVFHEGDVEVYLGDTLQESGFQVTGTGAEFGGTVRFDTSPPASTIVTLCRRLPVQRVTDFQESGALRAKVLNDELDYLTAALQQVDVDAQRSVRLHPADADARLTLPKKADRAGQTIAFDSNGDLITVAAGAVTAGGSGEPSWQSLDDVPAGTTNTHFTVTERAKLQSIDTGAEVNPPAVSAAERTAGTATELRSVSPSDISDMVRTHAPSPAVGSVFGRTGAVTATTGDYSLAQITETADAKIMTAAERTKLAGIDNAAQVNPPMVSAAEKTAATETAPRSFAPKDIKEIAEAHAGTGGGSGSTVYVSPADVGGGVAGDTPVAASSAAGLVPAGGSTGQALRKTSGGDYDYAWGDLPAAAGGLTAAYQSISDGSNSAVAAGAAAFRLRSADSALAITVAGGDATFGDNALFRIEPAGIAHDALSGVAATRHVDHALVAVNAGAGLTGGGDLTASRTLAVSFGGTGAADMAARADHVHAGLYAAASHSHSAADLTDEGDFYAKTRGGSLAESAGTVQLAGDSVSPGGSKYYGTDAAGAKGFFALPAGGGGGLANAFAQITDGVNTAAASGAGAFKLRSASNRLSVSVADNDATHGDHALFTLNEANISHDALAGFAASRHVDHAAVSITAGTGLAGGGSIDQSRSLSVNFAGGGTAPTAARSDHTHPLTVDVLHAIARATADSASIAAGATGFVPFNSLHYTRPGVAGYAATSGEITIPQAGDYEIGFDIYVRSDAASTKAMVDVRLQSDDGGSWSDLLTLSMPVFNTTATIALQRSAIPMHGYRLAQANANRKIRVAIIPATGWAAAVVCAESRLTVRKLDVPIPASV
jgi:hypothetical protein